MTVDKKVIVVFHMNVRINSWGDVKECGCKHCLSNLTISFQSSSNGVTLGTPNKATITILSNDNAFGIIAFNSVRTRHIPAIIIKVGKEKVRQHMLQLAPVHSTMYLAFSPVCAVCWL